MSSKPKSEERKETDNVLSSTEFASCFDPPSLPSSHQSGGEAGPIQTFPNNCDELSTVSRGRIPREESAEEILQASIDFKRSSSKELTRAGLRNDSTGPTQFLYPTASLAAALGEEKSEETECFDDNLTQSPGFACAYGYDDDPVARILMEEEFLTHRGRFYVSKSSKDFIVDTDDEDSKPPAQSVAFASAYQADARSGVMAELVEESLNQAIPAPLMYPSSTMNGMIATEEATVLDSKPAALPSGWSSESAEATVLDDSAQNGGIWTMHHEDVGFEEIAVTGRDEAEATIVEIADNIHPSDLDIPGVEAELIGREYSQSDSLQMGLERSGILSVNSSGYAVACREDSIVDGSIPGAVIRFSDEFHPTDHSGLDTIHGDSFTLTASDQLYENSASQVATSSVEHATVIEITEDPHPADLDFAGVHAEFLGREFSSEDHFRGSQSWAGPVDPGASVLCNDIAVVTATSFDRVCDNEAVAVEITDGRETTSALADPSIRIERSHSLTDIIQRAHALPLSPSDFERRSVSAPHGDHVPFAESSSALEAQHAMDLDPMNVSYPVKETPPPPPLPPRPVPACDRPQHSSDSQLLRGDSNSANSATPSRSAGFVPFNGELMSQHQRLPKWRGANVVRQSKDDFDFTKSAGSILTRTLLPWSVFPSETTGMWVATVNTNQKALDNNDIAEASKALRAFSVPTRDQAEALARAWAPPRMLPFSKNSRCFVCEARFTVFKRPCHCRNCGVCVCSSCVVQWSSKMIPETYNIKQESIVNICRSCDWLCSAFRMALIDGNLDQSIAIHSTGNVNLVTPFANVKGELFYPVHCAVLGGSLEILQWLVDIHCCPLRSIRISGKTRQSSGSFTPILTSRGRSLLGIAIENEKIDIVRYLVVDKGMPLTAEKDLTKSSLIRVLERILRVLPPPLRDSHLQPNAGSGDDQASRALPIATPPQTRMTSVPNSSSSRQSEESWRAHEALAHESIEQDSEGSVDDACIICFANSIDCVVTPCGHQICCMQCSTNISRCPVCGVDCSFIRVFRAN